MTRGGGGGGGGGHRPVSKQLKIEECAEFETSILKVNTKGAE